MVPYAAIKDARTVERREEQGRLEKDGAGIHRAAEERKGRSASQEGSIKSHRSDRSAGRHDAWDWYGGTPPYKVTPLDGIKAAWAPNVKVNYAAEETGDAAVNAARNSDVAVVVVGNRPDLRPEHGARLVQHVRRRRTLPCTDPGDGREGRDRESITTRAGGVGEAGLRSQ